MKRILVIRFSALGDVAMTIPVLHSLALQYPDRLISVLSRKAFQPLFAHLPDNVDFIAADLSGEHEGVTGLYRLFRHLKKRRFDGVADLHDVLRTRFLRLLFALSGVRVAHIRKGRGEKRALTRKRNKVFKPLKSSFARYAEVFDRLGLPVSLQFTSIYGETRGESAAFAEVTGKKGTEKWIGIAPFAKHEGKTYPLEAMEQVVARLVTLEGVKLFLFGGGKEEENLLTCWERQYPRVVALPGKLKMNGELALMSWLDVMISMDSANMHLASLVHTPVISVWGATHPWCGFMGWGQEPGLALQVEMACRPCSVFGNKPCHRKDYACLHGITPDALFQRIKHFLSR